MIIAIDVFHLIVLIAISLLVGILSAIYFIYEKGR
jgi:hypothetical protein